MPLDVQSMFQTILESQERMISRSSTSFERAYEPTTPLEYQPHGNFGQENQYGYGERYQPWDLEYEEQEVKFPQASNEENITNMLEKLLENEERGRIEIERQLDSLSTKIDVNGKALSSRMDGVITHVESISNKLYHMIEDQEESITPLYNTNTYEECSMDMEIAVEEDVQLKDGFQQEAEDSIHELELLLGCMVDENLAQKYEEQVEPTTFMGYSTKIMDEEVSLVGRVFEDLCDDSLVVECIEETREISLIMDEFSTKEEIHVKLTSKKGAMGEKSKENKMLHIEESPKEVQQEDSPMDKPFDNQFGILSTKELIVDDPRKVPFEEIRMNEFRGWFYDEYDPGDLVWQEDLHYMGQDLLSHVLNITLEAGKDPPSH